MFTKWKLLFVLQVGNASLPFKPKGVKRERREAKEAKANGEGNKHAEKKQKQEDDASAWYCF